MVPAVFDVTTAKIAAVSREGRQDLRFPRERVGAAFRRLPEGLRGLRKTRRMRTTSRANKLPNLDGVKALELEKLDHEAALHAAAAALQRSFAGEGAGRARHRTAVDLRVDHQHHPGPRVCGEARRIARAVLSHRDRRGGVRSAGEELPLHLRHASTRPSSKKSWTTSKTARRSGPTC